MGFFIQARAESNQNSTSSIVGVWTPLNTNMARTATCNGVDGVSDHQHRHTLLWLLSIILFYLDLYITTINIHGYHVTTVVFILCNHIESIWKCVIVNM